MSKLSRLVNDLQDEIATEIASGTFRRIGYELALVAIGVVIGAASFN